MRWLDRVVGGALCVALARLLAGRPSRRIDGPAIRPVLFVGLAEMGSVVLAEPALLRARDSHHAIPHFLIFAQNRDSLALTGTVGAPHTFALRTDSLPALAVDVIRFACWARRRGVVVAIDTDPCARFSALLAWLSGAATRAGFGPGPGQPDDRAALFTRVARYHPDLHLAQNLIVLTDAALGPVPAVGTPTLPAMPTIARSAIDVNARLGVVGRLRVLVPDYRPEVHRIVLVNPNFGDLLPQRRWPRDNYAQLIRDIVVEHADVFVFLIGTRADAVPLAALVADIGERRCASIAGAFVLTELPALFACSSVLLTSDSGPAHFAAVTPMPVVVMFGPETPARYRPLGDVTALAAGLGCSPCISLASRRQTDCPDNRCMRAIGVATVKAEVGRRLNAGAAYKVAG